MSDGEYAPGYVERMLPGAEDWAPEDDSVNEEYPEDYKGEIFKIVGPPEDRDWQGRLPARFRKPYYSTEGGARKGLPYFPAGSHIEIGEVTWRRL